MRLRAVIFDYGEVLSMPANRQVHGDMLTIAGLPEEIYQRHYWESRADYDAGILNGAGYWEKIGRQSGVQFSRSQIDELIRSDARMWMDLNEPMLAWAAEVKRAGLRTAILSNIGDEVLGAMRQRFSWLGQFDAHTWSCELGMVKPNPAIYRDPLKKLGVKPEEALFLDNLEENVVGARGVGLHALVFKDIEQLGDDLRRFEFDLPSPQRAAAL